MQGTIRRRGAGWAYQFSLTKGGKRRHVTKGGFRTRRQAEAALTEALAGYAKGEHVEPSRMTLGQYLADEWLPVVQHRLKPSTWAGYRDIVDGRIVPHLGDVRLSELTAGHIARLYSTLRESGRKDGTGGLSERTVKHTHTCLSKALEDAARRRLIARNPTRDVDPPRPRNVETKVWTSDEARAFLASTAGDRLHACWVLAVTTGLRRGELLGLRWDDVDLDAGTLAVRRARVAVAGEMVEGEPKSGRARFRRPRREHRRRPALASPPAARGTTGVG